MLFDLVGHHMLPATRLLVYQVPGKTDHVDQQAFGQAVLADHTGGDGLSLVGQADRPARPVDVTVTDQTIEHLGDGRG